MIHTCVCGPRYIHRELLEGLCKRQRSSWLSMRIGDLFAHQLVPCTHSQRLQRGVFRALRPPFAVSICRTLLCLILLCLILLYLILLCLILLCVWRQVPRLTLYAQYAAQHGSSAIRLQRTLERQPTVRQAVRVPHTVCLLDTCAGLLACVSLYKALKVI